MNLILVGDVTPIQRTGSYKYISYSISEEVMKIINDADIFIGNLETTITDTNEYDQMKMVSYKIPVAKASRIIDMFSYVNIANNHILDYGYQGMIDTIDYLNKKKIYHTGAGDNINDTMAHVIINKNDKKVGVFSATDHPAEWRCDSNRRGCVNYLEFGSEKSLGVIRKIVNDIRRENIDLIIFSYHYGPNYKDDVDVYKEFMYKILMEGVDVIHGHSAHHINKISKFRIDGRNKYVIYSNGEFINDYGWDSPEKTEYKMDHTMMVKLKVEKDDVHLSVIPIKINYTYTNDQSYYAGVKSARVDLMSDFGEKEYIYNVIKRID